MFHTDLQLPLLHKNCLFKLIVLSEQWNIAETISDVKIINNKKEKIILYTPEVLGTELPSSNYNDELKVHPWTINIFPFHTVNGRHTFRIRFTNVSLDFSVKSTSVMDKTTFSTFTTLQSASNVFLCCHKILDGPIGNRICVESENFKVKRFLRVKVDLMNSCYMYCINCHCLLLINIDFHICFS